MTNQNEGERADPLIGGNFFVRWLIWSLVFALISTALDIIIHRGPSGLSWASIVLSALIYGAFLAALAQKQFIQTKIPVKWLYAAFIGFAILVTISMILLNDRVLSPAISTGAWAVALVLCLVAHRRKQD